MRRKVKIKAPAKLNLFLEITGKRKDGYHELRSVFAKVSVFDELEISAGGRKGTRVSFAGSAEKIPERKNTAYAAAEKFAEEFGVSAGIDIAVKKTIPSGAGMGGGSSDAAAVLRGLCTLFGIDFRKNFGVLRKIGAAIGADVPFFLYDDTFCSVWGKGERIRPLRAAARRDVILIVKPERGVATGDAYAGVKPPGSREIEGKLKILAALRRALARGEGAGGFLFNRFEESVFKDRKDISALKEKLLAAGASGALMTGSGSAVFAFFGSERAALGAVPAREYCKKSVFLAKFL